MLERLGVRLELEPDLDHRPARADLPGCGFPVGGISAPTDAVTRAPPDDAGMERAHADERIDAQLALGLSEQEIREILTEELLRAMRTEGERPTVHAIAHSIARLLELDHLRIAEQLERAGVSLARF